VLRDLDHGVLPPEATRLGWDAEIVRALLTGNDDDLPIMLLPSGHDYGQQIVDLHEQADADLERQIHAGPLFTTRTGNRLTQAAVFATVRRLARTAGLAAADRICPHSLRHAAATAALDDGAPLRDVQDFLGHADPRTTRRYDRNRGSLDRSPAHRLGVLYAGS
jgi:integrase